MPDIVFADIKLVNSTGITSLKNISSLKSLPVIPYSTITTMQNESDTGKNFTCVQFPGSVQNMAKVLQNLFDTETHTQPVISA